jgi:threonine dehydratase
MELTYPDITSATERIAGAIRPVTLVPLDAGTITSSGAGPCQVWLACEFLQYTGSIAARGARNLVSAHREDGTLPDAGITLASRGNAGLAAAWAARCAGARATVFLPETLNRATLDRLESYGAGVHMVGARLADARTACREFAGATGALLVDVGEDPLIAAGAGTLVAEIRQHLPDLGTLVVPVGAGGVFTGIAIAADQYGIRVVNAEPERYGVLHSAISTGRIVDVEVDSIAADSFGTHRISPAALAAAQRCDTRSVVVTDTAIIAARRALWRQYRLVVEHAAATALAALTARAYRPRPGEKVCVVLSGANTDPTDLAA